jgi:hypothetical protein
MVKKIQNKHTFLAPKTISNGDTLNLFVGGLMNVSVIIYAFWCQVSRD